MRRTIDLHLRPKSPEEIPSMLNLASDLGYNAIALSADSSEISKAKSICSSLGIDLITRLDLRPKSEGELMTALSRLRRRFEIVSVVCETKTVSRQAAKDHRVDILEYSPSLQNRTRVWFDHQEAVLASESNCSYEIDVSDILLHGHSSAAKLLSILRLETDNARKHEVPIVLSSGATSKYLLRDPRALISLTELIGVSEEEAMDMISSNPFEIVERNREKLSRGFISPGVKVVRKNAR